MKIPDEKLKLIDKLFDKGISIAQIAREVNLTYSCVYNYKAARIKGFNSYDEYQKHLTPKKVSEKKIKLMEELFAKNLSYAGIARKTNLA
ncbi:MAG: helix-turn-helix domain-containing protein, partial [Ignavibacteria bacterium]|nr:helix-turn-helix domain-containing protein [Ignavibacteria bacterium]